MAFKPKAIVIHNTQTPSSFTFEQIASILRSRKLKGYHRLWRKGMTHDLNPLDAPAEHVKKHNHEYAGFALVGDYNKNELSLEDATGAALAVALMLKELGLPADAIVAHRDVPDNDTDCPGKKFPWEMFAKMVTWAYYPQPVEGWQDAGVNRP